MSERLTQIDNEIAFLQRRKSLAMAALLETNDKICELATERNQLLGNTAVRHLHAVPDLPPEPDGAA